ncbi:hypothetical protein M0R45_036986 [Rubus argutus]|uniref:3-hydroxyisobutyryl-CoA hydrolase n=1 Tax=Rubus argutus TaxID=59490 RepID=A0AAW1W275_RUBAR
MASLSPDDEQAILVQEPNSFVRSLTLNRPEQLNALSEDMVSRLIELFLVYQQDAKVKLVILKGEGRAFCAGGDVAALARLLFEGNWRTAIEIVGKLYKLMHLVATNKKPQVAILDGIVVGAGAAISIHGRFRVATENSIFAMPETALGSFPDMGSSHFLSRLPGSLGEYLALTGARLDGADMLACGLATHFVPSDKLALLEEALVLKMASPNILSYDLADNISAIIKEYSQQPNLSGRSALNRMDTINKCFSKRTAEEIFTALENEAANSKTDDTWFSSTIHKLNRAAPASLKIALRSVRQGRTEGVVECLVREHRISSIGLRVEAHTDFKEGCRALLLDKDGNPKWEPSRLELVDDEMIDKVFTPFDENDELKELQVPIISKL